MSCSVQRGLAPSNLPEEVVTERLVPVYLSPDSAMLYALLECDSDKQVVLKEYYELKSQSVQSDFSFENGGVVYKTKTVHDTIYLRARDRIVYKPVPVPGEKVNYLTFWQQFWIYAGRLLLAALVVVLALKKLILK
ncbi:hypothetical protein EZS27_015559 [termite gut metagenome]|uniref:Uncharacterized protein n=1 Tax=termite gut metagenome TaxID=433724 RepID=A0A5J4RRY6_9ZZZZ